MRLPYFDYHEPATLEEALGQMAEHQGELRILAGGTELLPLMKFGLARPSCIMDAVNVPALRGISTADGAFRIGAMTKLAELSESPEIRHTFNALYEAVESVAAPPIRSIATVGGNLCQNSRCLFFNQSETWRKEKPPCYKAGGDVCLAVPGGKKCFSVYQGDLAPAMMALAGRIRVESATSWRLMPLEKLFSGDGKRPIALSNDEMITEVLLPVPKGRVGSAYRKMRMRSAMDYPLLSAAACISIDSHDRIDAARIVLAAAGPAPFVAHAAEELLQGQNPVGIDLDNVGRAAVRGVHMVDNLVLPGSYRKKMIPVFVRRAIEAAIQAARELQGRERP